MEKRNLSIEGLRGICAIGIVLFHMIARYSELYLESVYPNYIGINYWGEILTSIFLIISSYFLYSRTKEFNILKYYKRRILRLWPSYFLAITLIFLTTRFIILPGRTGGIKDYCLNVILVNGYIGTMYIDGAHWYLTTIISAIVINGLLKSMRVDNNPISFLIWIAIVIGLKYLSTLLVGGVAHLITNGLQTVFCGPYVGTICVGIGIHKIIEDVTTQKNPTIEGFIICIAGFIASVILQSIWRVVGIIIGVCLILLCLRFPKSFLSIKPLVLLGSVSYQIYLIHQNIGFIIQNQLVQKYGEYNILYAVIATLITILAGIILYIFEKKVVTKLIPDK